MSRNDPKIELLRRVPALAGYRDKQLADLARLVDEVELPSGHELTREGKPGTQAYLIVDGEASVTVKDKLVATLGSGQFVGEMALLDRSPCSATVIATTPMRVLVMDPASFSELLDHTSIARRIASTLSTRLRDAEGGATWDSPAAARAAGTQT